ncbi:MAG: 3H domain-containing protein, partial [Actinomycetota bacterium]
MMEAAAADARRRRLLALLRSGGARRGAELAREFAVSRQVIVTDVAVLRAGGHPIVGTPGGYLLLDREGTGPQAVLACKHDRRGTGAELRTLVDHGLTVLDVIVEHLLYGELRGNLMISSRQDAERFLRNLRKGRIELLSSLTGGVHLHTVRAPSAEALKRARAALLEKGILLEPSRRRALPHRALNKDRHEVPGGTSVPAATARKPTPWRGL